MCFKSAMLGNELQVTKMQQLWVHGPHGETLFQKQTKQMGEQTQPSLNKEKKQTEEMPSVCIAWTIRKLVM